MILLNITNKLIFIYFQFQQNICKKKNYDQIRNVLYLKTIFQFIMHV